MKSNTEISIEIQQRMQTYLIALAFTISGFAIQTFKPTGYITIDSLFILSIALILISAILGVYRMDHVALMYNAQDDLYIQENAMQKIETTNEQNEIYKSNVTKLNELKDRLEKLYL